MPLIVPEFWKEWKTSYDMEEIIRVCSEPSPPWFIDIAETQEWVKHNCNLTQLVEFVLAVPDSDIEAFVKYVSMQHHTNRAKAEYDGVLSDAVSRMCQEKMDVALMHVIKAYRIDTTGAKKVDEDSLRECMMNSIHRASKKTIREAHSVMMERVSIGNKPAGDNMHTHYVADLVRITLLIPERGHATATLLVEKGLRGHLVSLLNSLPSLDIRNYQQYLLEDLRLPTTFYVINCLESISGLTTRQNWSRIDEDGLIQAIADTCLDKDLPGLEAILMSTDKIEGLNFGNLFACLVDTLPGYPLLRSAFDAFIRYPKPVDYGAAIRKCMEESTDETRRRDMSLIVSVMESHYGHSASIGLWVQVARFIGKYGALDDVRRLDKRAPYRDSLPGTLGSAWSTAIREPLFHRHPKTV